MGRLDCLLTWLRRVCGVTLRFIFCYNTTIEALWSNLTHQYCWLNLGWPAYLSNFVIIGTGMEEITAWLCAWWYTTIRWYYFFYPPAVVKVNQAITVTGTLRWWAVLGGQGQNANVPIFNYPRWNNNHSGLTVPKWAKKWEERVSAFIRTKGGWAGEHLTSQ